MFCIQVYLCFRFSELTIFVIVLARKQLKKLEEYNLPAQINDDNVEKLLNCFKHHLFFPQLIDVSHAHYTEI